MLQGNAADEAAQYRRAHAALSALLGFGVPYSNTFRLKGTNMKYKFILFLPGYFKAQFISASMLKHLRKPYPEKLV